MPRPRLMHPDTGQIVRASHAGADVLRESGYTEADAVVDGLQPPAQSAPKAEWVAYATAQGIEDADELTKAELVERLG